MKPCRFCGTVCNDFCDEARRRINEPVPGTTCKHCGCVCGSLCDAAVGRVVGTLEPEDNVIPLTTMDEPIPYSVVEVAPGVSATVVPTPVIHRHCDKCFFACTDEDIVHDCSAFVPRDAHVYLPSPLEVIQRVYVAIRCQELFESPRFLVDEFDKMLGGYVFQVFSADGTSCDFREDVDEDIRRLYFIVYDEMTMPAKALSDMRAVCERRLRIVN